MTRIAAPALRRRRWLPALAGLVLLSSGCTWDQLFAWNGGKPTILGYATQPNYDRRIKTVRVKIFKNATFWAVVPVPGLEEQLTQAIVREIEAKTPYKVVAGDADTELTGSVRGFTKAILNYTQLNEIREAETTLTVEVLWRNLRTGDILSAPAQRALEPPPPAGLLPGMQDPLLQPGGPGLPQTPLISPPTAPSDQPATMTAPQPPPQPPSLGGAPMPPPVPSQPGVPGTPGAPGGPGGPGKLPQGVMVRSVAYFRPEIGESISTAQQRNVDRMAVHIISLMEKGW